MTETTCSILGGKAHSLQRDRERQSTRERTIGVGLTTEENEQKKKENVAERERFVSKGVGVRRNFAMNPGWFAAALHLSTFLSLPAHVGALDGGSNVLEETR